MSERQTTLRIEIDEDAGGVLLRLRGEIDLNTSPTLRARLLEVVETPTSRVLVDLSGLSYMDSSGVGTLVDFKRRLDQRKSALVLFGLQSRVRSLLEITRLDRYFKIADTLEQARQA